MNPKTNLTKKIWTIGENEVLFNHLAYKVKQFDNCHYLKILIGFTEKIITLESDYEKRVTLKNIRPEIVCERQALSG